MYRYGGGGGGGYVGMVCKEYMFIVVLCIHFVDVLTHIDLTLEPPVMFFPIKAEYLVKK